MKHKVQVIPVNQIFEVEDGYNLGKALQVWGYEPDMYCGGRGTCGKCRVNVDGYEVLACQFTIKKDVVVHLNNITDMQILDVGNVVSLSTDLPCGYYAAIDIGTTTIVCHLLDASGKELAFVSMLNPQRKYGADVVTRIQASLEGSEEALIQLLREGVHQLLHQVCRKADISIEEVMRISLVGNPCMQQFFFAISVKNLTKIPFIPEIRQFQVIPASVIFPDFVSAEIYMVPDISGYAGADIIGCVISSRMYRQKGMTLLIDIGTNGEMVLGNKDYMVSCSTAAGPAMEGANIQFGMNGRAGAIDYVSLQNGDFYAHVIGNVKAEGICGSGIVDAVAGLLESGIINKRGRIQTAEQKPEYASILGEYNGQRAVHLTEEVWITQDDIRQVQLAKAAIAAGIEQLIKTAGIDAENIEKVLLAGAFGNYMRKESACTIGLLPGQLQDRIEVIGNAAGGGAILIGAHQKYQKLSMELSMRIRYLDLGTLPDFQKSFGRNMNF